jgi:hypothetical protein
MKRFVLALAAASALCLGFAGGALASPDAENASCMGLGSFFYAQGAGSDAVGVRADIAHLVKGFSPQPGAHYRVFAQAKEDGTIPAPCGARIE